MKATNGALYLDSITFDWNIPVSSVELDENSIQLDLNGDSSATINAIVLPENASNKNIIWSTSDESVATVDNGVITAVALGEATVTVTSEDGGKTATCNVEVIDSTPPPTEDVTIETSIVAIANTYGWANSYGYGIGEENAVPLDENVSFYTTGTGNNGKYYTNGNNWRLYHADAGNIVIKAADGYTIKSVTLNFSINKDGYLIDSEDHSVESGHINNVNDSSVTYTVAGPENGQVRITNISVTYSSDSQTPAVELSSIAATDYVSSFTTGDTFNFGGTVTATYSDSSTKNVTGSASFSGYDMSKAGTQTVTVSYTEDDVSKTTTYQITVSDPVPVVTLTDIVVTAIPTKVEFIVGDTFSSAGLEVTATYSNDATKDVTSSVSLTGYDMSSAGSQTVIISYTEDEVTKTTNYEITVNEPTPVVTLESIAITTKPDKLSYIIGEDLDLTGMVVTATYSDKTTAPITDYTVSGYDKNKADTQTITITYQEKTDTFTVTVNNTLSSISIADQTSTFEKGDTFSFGGTVTATYSDGTSNDVTSSTTFSGYDMSKAGTQTVTVSYTEDGVTKTTTYEITVNEPTPVVTLTSITVTTMPTKVEYELGEKLDSKGLVVTATYSDGSTSVITDYTLSALDSSKVGEETITITYQGLTTTFKVLVVNSLVSISISNPTTTFEKGDEFSFGGIVTATYHDGSTEDVTEYATFSGYDMSKVGTQTVTVSFTSDIVEKTATYQITVNEPAPVATLTGITITTNPTKLEYVTGEDLDLIGMVVTATYSDQSTSAVTDYIVSGYDKNKVGTQTITVTYQGYTATFSVTVIDGLKEQKDAAIKSLNEYYNSIDLSKYSLDNLMKLLSGLRSGESTIRAATTIEEINVALANAKAYLASIPQEEVPVKPDAPTNTCGGDIFATSAILSIIALFGAALIAYKKHK